jgi:hypothetical protein
MDFIQTSNKYIEQNWDFDKEFIKEYEFCLGVNNAEL